MNSHYQRIHNHLVIVAILVISVILGFGFELVRITLATSDQPERTLPISVSEQIADRSTTSIRSLDPFDQHPIILSTPVPTPPTAIILPTPTPPPQVIVMMAPIRGSGVLAWPLSYRGGINTYFSTWHQAIDLVANCGTPVLAALNGTITWAGWLDNGGGYVIELAGVEGFVLSYDHLSVIGVNVGDPVLVGQVIGQSGSTGISTGCHLHFGVLIYGVSVNPLLYL